MKKWKIPLRLCNERPSKCVDGRFNQRIVLVGFETVPSDVLNAYSSTAIATESFRGKKKQQLD